jgi:hypothetical protein
MAATKISALTTLSTPIRKSDYAPVYNAADATKTYKTLLSDFGTYVTTVNIKNVAPADSSTYFLSPYAETTGLVTVAANCKSRVARTGRIVAVYLDGACTTGSAENSTFSLRLNDTTDTTISSVVTFNATPFSFSNTALAIAVTAGDFINIKWATPAWVTNPTGVYIVAQIVFA